MPSNAEVKEQVRKDWTSNAKPWKTWRSKFIVQSANATKLVVEGASLAPGMKVLDLASGTGEPAFSIARAIGPSGHVTATDLVPEMLDVMSDVIAAESIGNVKVEVADMEKLPYADGSFDRVTSRFGIMFPPEPVLAAKEMKRVLKPGGKVTLLVWGPPTSSFWSAFLGPFTKRANLPPPPPDAPTPTRFAKPGSVSEVLSGGGFSNVQETPVTIDLGWPGPAEELFRMQKEFVPQVFDRFAGALSPAEYEAAVAEVKDNFVRAEKNGEVHLEGIVYLATGTA
jgi:ubiquinone/menaquinone biosynthesis C-methylase UbiE